jgi:hypothetical protein
MDEPRTNRSFYALRVCPDAPASAWWRTALENSHSAPRPVQAILGGRTRVELTAEEAVVAIHWAAQQSGWEDHGEHPLFVYPPLATE